MNANQRTPSTGAMIRHWTIACFAIAITTVKLSAADELASIDFRNRIPGIVDAPVFDFDGVSGLQGSRFLAGLYAGPAMNSLTTWGDSYAFRTGTNAGYWDYESPLLIVPGEFSLGQTIYYQVKIWEFWGGTETPLAFQLSSSKIYSMVITNTVMPLVGFESFKLEPERLRITADVGQTIIQWAHLGATRYELRSTTDLLPPIVWTAIFEWRYEWPHFDELRPLFSVTNATTPLPQFYRLQRWRQSWE
jgi:hypothetical protein